MVRARLAGTLLATLLLFGLAPRANAGTRTINFDDQTVPCDFSDTVPLRNQYAALGVTFAGPAPNQGGAVLNQCGNFGISGFSGSNFLAFNLSVPYAQPPETITFAHPIETFSIKAAQNGTGGIFTITGFDGPTNVSENSRSSTAAMASLTLAATRMTTVRLDYTAGTVPFMAFDDLTFATAPISGDDVGTVMENGRLDVGAPGVLANDTDPDHDPLIATLVRQPANGTVVLKPDGSYSYTPTHGFSGNDAFVYKAFDGTGNGNEATVRIKINPLPTPPPPPPPVLRLHLSTIGGWSVSDAGVTIHSMTVHGLKRGARVRLICKACHVNRTVKAKHRTLVLKKLHNRLLKRGQSFTLTVTLTGSIGDQLKMTVKHFGHKHSDFVRVAAAPFVVTHRCLPVGSMKPRKRC